MLILDLKASLKQYKYYNVNDTIHLPAVNIYVPPPQKKK